MGKRDTSDAAVEVHSRTAESSDTSGAESSRSGATAERPQLTRNVSLISTTEPTVYKVYKRRFFGLVQLILLNIVVSWDWTLFSPISNTAAQYFGRSETAINWLTTLYLFAFVAATPVTLYVLSKRGPKTSIIISSSLLLTGNWIKYGGTRSKHFAVTILGQVLIGSAQPFVLSAPSTYSDLWFSGAGRTSATAVASLANPLGAALGQLVAPFWATKPSEVPNAVLYTSIIASVASLPSFFIPAKPPTPPTAATVSNTDTKLSIFDELRILLKSPEFHLLFIPFSIYVGFFNSFSSLLNQFLGPYGFSEDDAGLAGAVLILVGLVAGAIVSPLTDKYKFYIISIKVMTPITGLMYLVFLWAPPSKSIPFVYLVCAVLGAASFGLVPVVLEFLVEMHYPVGPMVSSTLCWASGSLLGGIFVIVMDQLKSNKGGPPGNMHKALIFQAVVAVVMIPVPLMLGLFGRKSFARPKRLEAERRGMAGVDIEGEVDEEILPLMGE